MKKNIIIIFVLVFSLLLGGEKAFASSASVVLKGANKTIVGEKFDVTLEIDSEESLSGVETYLSYDDSMAEFLSADEGIAGGKGLLRVNIKNFEDVDGKLKYKMTFLAKLSGNFTMTFSDDVHLYAVNPDNEISVATNDLEMRIKNPRKASSDSSLIGIKVAGGVLTPKFSPSVLDYKVNVGGGVDDITVGVTTADKGANYSLVKDYGDKLRSGENNIYIIVKAEDGSKTNYNIVVIKENEASEETKDTAKDTKSSAKQEEEPPIETSSDTGSKGSTEEEHEYVPDAPGEEATEETDNNDSKQMVIYVIISAIVILGIMLMLGLVLYMKNKRNEEDEE
ncbi:cadherin-like beta sandwich domain-containing protein [Catonella massiliensis]|uniref:Cadherin-like beta sandwich domain-containing protein n=1 Tax=Catonella massiliensis TaxID=2799636 RepID=A0ABS1J1A0_9FIRM|nr:cadherin-like beta sandwich domain-containing protein [Catonella massiliensis]MBK5897934.1 cadherin-like beta sandwich domain-containing protein [Catonella massiliensis]